MRAPQRGGAVEAFVEFAIDFAARRVLAEQQQAIAPCGFAGRVARDPPDVDEIPEVDQAGAGHAGERGDRAPRAEDAPAEGAAPERINYVSDAAPAPTAGLQAAPIRTLPPKVQPYHLPVAELAEVAQGSGLEWVNSDADKVAAAHAAIAAEPKPVHVPRERPPVVVVDEGPLVLVETRKDLRNLSLPF